MAPSGAGVDDGAADDGAGADDAGATSGTASSRRSTGATSVPNSSIAARCSRCGTPPNPSCTVNRRTPYNSWKVEILSMTSCGLPTTRPPPGVAWASNARRGSAKPTPRWWLFSRSPTAKCGYMRSRAPWLVRPTKPWVLMLIGIDAGSCPASCAAWRYRSTVRACEVTGPSRRASAMGRPRRPARTAEAGVPPTPTQTGRRSCSGRGATSAATSGARYRPLQVIGFRSRSATSSSSFSA